MKRTHLRHLLPCQCLLQCCGNDETAENAEELKDRSQSGDAEIAELRRDLATSRQERDEWAIAKQQLQDAQQAFAQERASLLAQLGDAMKVCVCV